VAHRARRRIGNERVLDLIDEVLDIARIESGYLSLSPEPVTVEEVLEDALTMVQPQAQAREIGIRIHVDPGKTTCRRRCRSANTQRPDQAVRTARRVWSSTEP
jgi:signal transduction histidine kinase